MMLRASTIRPVGRLLRPVGQLLRPVGQLRQMSAEAAPERHPFGMGPKMARFYAFMWQDAIVGTAAIGFGAWFAQFVYFWSPTPVTAEAQKANYTDKVQEAMTLTEQAKQAEEKTKRKMLLKRVDTITETTRSRMSDWFKPMTALFQSKLKRTLSMDMKEIDAALEELSQIKGDDKLAPMAELRKLKEELAGLPPQEQQAS